MNTDKPGVNIGVRLFNQILRLTQFSAYGHNYPEQLQ